MSELGISPFPLGSQLVDHGAERDLGVAADGVVVLGDAVDFVAVVVGCEVHHFGLRAEHRVALGRAPLVAAHANRAVRWCSGRAEPPGAVGLHVVFGCVHRVPVAVVARVPELQLVAVRIFQRFEPQLERAVDHGQSRAPVPGECAGTVAIPVVRTVAELEVHAPGRVCVPQAEADADADGAFDVFASDGQGRDKDDGVGGVQAGHGVLHLPKLDARARHSQPVSSSQ